MLQPADSYDAAYGGFRWRLPALIQETAKGAVETFRFARLKALPDRFANAPRHLGVGRGGGGE